MGARLLRDVHVSEDLCYQFDAFSHPLAARYFSCHC